MQTDKEKSLDEWLPITSNRNAKWWYRAFHNVTAMVGAAVRPQLAICHGTSWMILATPVFDMIETVLVKKLHFPPCIALRLIAPSLFVALTMLVGVCIPFFGGLLGFFGAFALAPATYFFPCIMWLVICMPKRFSLSWIKTGYALLSESS